MNSVYGNCPHCGKRISIDFDDIREEGHDSHKVESECEHCYENYEADVITETTLETLIKGDPA